MSGKARYNGKESWEEWRQDWQNEERCQSAITATQQGAKPTQKYLYQEPF